MTGFTYAASPEPPRQPTARLWDDEWDECPFCHISAQEHYDSIDGHWFSCELMKGDVR